ncbi:MAG: 30S ribosome-binding factor RbfA [Oscillospiraceae bacterium]|nr:30S ribosome-binding factor RbfA [Oscillospiraceae bacterium]
MATNKLQRINEDIARELSALLRDVKEPRVQQGMLSIVAVETTPDLKFCKVYLSVLGMEDERRMQKGLESAGGHLRRALGQALNIRHVPELNFKLDKSMEHGAHVSEILRRLEVEGEPDGRDEATDD